MFDTPTQLEDVFNQVAQSKIGDQRLRNEAIRARMAEPWAAPATQAYRPATGSQPTSLKDNPTLANLYGKTLEGMSGSGTNLNGFKSTYDGTGGGLGYLNDSQAGYLKQGINIAGQAAGMPGIITGMLSTAIPGIFGSKSGEDQAEAIQNTVLNTGMGMALPGVTTALSGGTALYNKLFGTNYDWNPSRGLKSIFSGQPYDYMARTGGGFFTAPTPSSGEASPTKTYSGSGTGNAYGPGSGGSGWGTSATYASSGNSNYSPYGGSGYSSNSDSGDD